MTAYYNEFDKYAAEWLRNLIDAGHIAAGVVDERSIEDVFPGDLRGFTQCHFFAGIGVWSYALRRAGWPDDRPVWTGSCPCQPFSQAGDGAGFADERHLWPAWHHLIKQGKPASVPVLGEQVASKDAGPWIDLVQDDMEALDHAFCAVAFPACGVGAPHIRRRAYFVADANGHGRPSRRQGRSPLGHGPATEPDRSAGLLGNAGNERLAQRFGQPGVSRCEGGAGAGQAAERAGVHAGWMADDILQQRPDGQPGIGVEHDPRGRIEGATAVAGLRGNLYPGPTNGLWAAADWLLCRDGKWRPVEPGTFPLAHGATSRVGRLRAYGNAICAEAAQAFISSYLDVRAAA